MASEHTITQALLEWINSFALGKTIRTTEELSDGTIIWEILQDIDPQYFLDEIPEQSPSDHWGSKWQNLKHIHKLLINYIRQQPDGLPSGLDPEPNLEQFAKKNSVKDANKLLKLLLIAAIRSPNAQTYVETLQTLSTPTQEGLKNIFEEAQNGELEPLDGADEAHEARDTTAVVDPELKFEEQMGNLVAENHRLTRDKGDMQKQLDEMNSRLVRLQENNETLQSRLATTEDRLISLKSGKGDIGPGAKGIESKYRQQEEVIANYEERLNSTQSEVDTLRMTAESLRAKAERVQSLQDDYDVLRRERDQLSRKANAAEKYRQKLQASQDFEKENQSLKNQIQDLQQQLKEADSQQRWTSEHEIELEEYRRILPRIEQECSEIQNLKKQLEFNNHALTERLRSAEEQHERDDALIGELRERIRDYEGSPGSPSLTPGSTTPRLQGNLQKDFEALGVKESNLCGLSPNPTLSDLSLTGYRKSEADDSRKEVESLKEQPRSVRFTPRHNTFNRRLADENQSSPPIDGFSEAFAETLRLSKAGSSQGYRCLSHYEPGLMHETNVLAFSDEYWRLYDQYTSTVKKLAEVQDSSMRAGRRSKIHWRTVISLAGKEKLDLISEVKEACRTETDDMRTDLREATDRISDLQTELNATHTLTGIVCHERDDLRKMLDQNQAELRAEDQEAAEEMKRLLAELTAQDGGVENEASQKSVVELIKQVAQQIENNLERLAKRAEVSEQKKPQLCHPKDKPLPQLQMNLAERSSSESTGSRSGTPSSHSLSRKSARSSSSISSRLSLLGRRLFAYIHQQNEHIKFLQDRISQLEEEASAAAANNTEDSITKERELELQKQIDALTREIALMGSSWYELQSKLHNNANVTISRYRYSPASLADAQKGWLARQRSAVAGR
ncbi:hypothetical protein AOCH_006483 [Aspergillus ochraceoroseus]|uniref:HOOK N-terminal domain-containing protein n=1 Tax=Aspergillus ochraceoroseus TaxID=138278 RepID=A0A0F8V4L3_9EURO|nr:hypothetical protein AOCH_006483 [Aspergillus ochraceoroseus]